MADDLDLWFDKDVKPYIEGENPFYDKILNEIAENIVKQAGG